MPLLAKLSRVLLKTFICSTDNSCTCLALHPINVTVMARNTKLLLVMFLEREKKLLSSSAKSWDTGSICAPSSTHLPCQVKLNQYTAISLITGDNKPTTKVNIPSAFYICGQPSQITGHIIKCRLVQFLGKKKKPYSSTANEPQQQESLFFFAYKMRRSENKKLQQFLNQSRVLTSVSVK